MTHYFELTKEITTVREMTEEEKIQHCAEALLNTPADMASDYVYPQTTTDYNVVPVGTFTSVQACDKWLKDKFSSFALVEIGQYRDDTLKSDHDYSTKDYLTPAEDALFDDEESEDLSFWHVVRNAPESKAENATNRIKFVLRQRFFTA